MRKEGRRNLESLVLLADNKEEVKAEGETEQMASSEKEDVAQTGETYEADQIKLKM